MKPDQPNDDVRFRDAVRTWKVDASLPPGFQDGVWQRIAAEEHRAKTPGLWEGLVYSVQAIFARPFFAATCVALFMAVGLSAGWMQGHTKAARMDSVLSERYVQSVDPYQAPRP
jgi:hypothetical protein